MHDSYPHPQDSLSAPASSTEGLIEVPTWSNIGSTAMTGDVQLNLPEQSPLDREKLLFEPYTASDVSDPSEFDYDAGIFGDDVQRQEALGNIKPEPLDPEQRDKEAFIKRGKVTEESVNAALPNLRGLRDDRVIKQELTRYTDEHPGTFRDADIMKALREDDQLRLSVGARLLSAAAAYPYEVSSEEVKASQYPGYRHIPNMKSKEYVALLALSMADGTYKDPGQAMGTQHNRMMVRENGRHREAARGVLRMITKWDQWTKDLA